MVSIKFRKTFKRWDCQYLKIHQFRQFFLQKHFRILKKHSGNIRGMILKQTFVECSSKILETLLCDYWNLPKDQYLLLSNHTLLTEKQLFHGELFIKFFSLKCSLNVLQMSRTLWHWGNTQRIFPEYCVTDGNLFPNVRAFTFTRQPIKWKFTWGTRVIHLRSSSVFLCRLKFWFAKKLKMNLCIAPTDMSFCKYQNHAKTLIVFKRWCNWSILCESIFQWEILRD